MDEPPSLADENPDVSDKQSSENFQKYIFELFEKNGVINDLRAYLRGHIVNVLKTSESGEALVCQKNFTQRLELTFQAINILIAEYLLRLEFSYSLSVFVSEIPLANMVFSFARMLLETNDHSELMFKDSDVFSILKYIGIKCDSDHAVLILDMYKTNGKTPLLLCILKCLPLYGKSDNEKEIILSSSQDSSISTKSSEELMKQFQEKCSHHAVCKTCRNRLSKLKEKFKKKKKQSESNINDTSLNSLSMDMFLKNISIMEKGLIDELFQQLKSVYEAEMEMMKQDEEKRVQKSVALHLLKLKQKKDQLESSYKKREAELQVALQEKKRFLWGLARTLREQHQHMVRAMADVKAETERLASKEDSLRLQLLEAEKILRERGAEMRKQISSELSILESHLESMKKERDSINRERQQLQELKLPNTNLKPLSESDDLKSHYELLRDELDILKRYVQSAKIDPKCVIERSTMTELSGVIDKFDGVLNNGKEVDSKSDKPRRLINDLKKLKNVNFDQISIDPERSPGRSSRSPGRSSTSSEAGDAPDVEIQSHYFSLRDENRRLREFARQQQEHIDSLSWQQARLQAQLSSQITPITPYRPVVIGSRTNPQNATFTPQNVTFTPNATFTPQSITFTPTSFTARNATTAPGNATSAPGNATTAPGNATTAPGNVTLNPQTSFMPNMNTPNPFIFQSTSSDSRRQSGLPQSDIAPQIGSQLLPTRPQPVTNQGALQRPRTAPLNQRSGSLAQRVHPTASANNVSVGWRIGAGEELSIFSNAGPRIVVPGDEIPFVGVIGTRHTDNRRYLINQWRSLRRRISPVSATKRSASPVTVNKNSTVEESPTNVQPSCSKNDANRVQSTSYDSNVKEEKPKRDKSPKTLLKEAKEKLKNNDQIKLPSTKREMSPNSVLREAKLRLKKLEIEAEAVEKSYLDFRKKRDQMKEEFKDNKLAKLDVKQNNSTYKLNETYTKEPPSTLDLDKYLSEINTKLDLSKYKSKITTANKVNPIPNEYTEKQDKKDYFGKTEFFDNRDYSVLSSKSYLDSKECLDKKDFLETPMTEFRKYYNSGKRYEKDTIFVEKVASKSPRGEKTDGVKSTNSPIFRRVDSPKRSPIRGIHSPRSPRSPKGTRKSLIRQVKNDKERELEILKQNISKIYNMSEHSIVEMTKSSNEIANEKENIPEEIIIDDVQDIKSEMFENNCAERTLKDTNLLRVDVENTSEVNNVNLDSNAQDYTLVIESSVNEAKIENSTPKDNSISTQMTIVVGPKRSPVNKDDKGENALNTIEISEDILQPVKNFNDSKTNNSEEIKLQIEDADYFDDFSADVDNYNSRSEFGNGIQSPISLGKTSDEDNFWESQ